MNFEELERLYLSSRLIAEAETVEDLYNRSGQIFKGISSPAVLFRVESNKLLVAASSGDLENAKELEKTYEIDTTEVSNYLRQSVVVSDLAETTVPPIFINIMKRLQLSSAALLPIRTKDTLTSILFVGTRDGTLSDVSLKLYGNLADLIAAALEKADAIQKKEEQLKKAEALASINELISSASDLQSFFHALLAKIQQIIGEYNMIVALYDERTN
ncbi:MAG: hypothetical protein JNM02_13480, partial [Anaerolineales bacterium]|nr:hypothetical protein [Anaerolineales bacterium]